MIHTAAALSIALLAVPAAASEREVLTERNRAIVTALAHHFYDERDVRGAFERYVAPDYIQHNPGIANGRNAAVAALTPMFAKAGSRFEVKQIIVEHWDVLQAVPATAANPHPMF